jgi:membrane associated rhomboid family serine protease
MGQRDYFDTKPTLGQNNNALVILFAANSFLFIILRFLKLVYDLDYGSAAYDLFQSKILYWFTLSANTHQLLSKPWASVLYMFSHYSIVGFISNMLWLWAFGYVLQDLVGNKKLIPIYLYGGFIGGLFFVVSATYIPFFQHNINPNYLFEGCSAAIVAVAIATTKLSPNYKMFQHIGSGFSLWLLTLLFIAVDIAFIASNNWAIAVAHIAAALVGYIFIVQLQNGNNWGNWMYNIVTGIDDVFNPEKKQKNKKQTDTLYYKETVAAFNKTENITEKKLNTILDKINLKGFGSLSLEEKKFLERASKG